MFLLYKMQHLKKHKLSTMYWQNFPANTTYNLNTYNFSKIKFIVLATSYKIIAAYLMPMFFLMRLVQFFLLYFRFLTLRSTFILGSEIKKIVKRKNMATLIGPLQPFKVPVNLLVRFRIPFVFTSYYSAHHWSLIKYRFLTAAFGLYKIQRLFKLYSFSVKTRLLCFTYYTHY
jgi:hypothetical protein